MEPERQQIEEQLRHMLASPTFQAAPKLSELFLYLVTQTLDGHAERLKGYTIGLDVFGREPDFDPSLDSIVRVQMGRLRHLLDDYYGGTGKSDVLHIGLDKGKYIPHFESMPPLDTEPGEEIPQPAQRGATPPTASPNTPDAGKSVPARRFLPGRGRLAAMAVLLLVALVGFAVLVERAGWLHPPKTAAPQPLGPIIYVAQYKAIDTDPLTLRLRNGLQYELVNRLAQFPNLGVLGFDTVAGNGGDAARRDLHGADFVLSGSVAVTGNEVQVTSQLTRTSDSLIIWSGQATSGTAQATAILSLQSDIASAVATQLGQPYGVIQQAMKAEIDSSKGVSMQDYQCVLSAYAYMGNKTAEGHAQVRDCLERIVERSPSYSTAWALLSWAYGDEERYGFNRRPGIPAFVRSVTAAERAVSTNPMNATAYEYLAAAKFHRGGDDAGVHVAIEKALQLSPNNSEILADAGWTLVQLDNSRRSKELIDKAIALNPGHPIWYYGGLALYALQNGMPEDALRNARLFAQESGPMAQYLLAAALRMNGQGAQADAVLRALGAKFPHALSDRRHMMQALRIRPELERLIFGG